MNYHKFDSPVRLVATEELQAALLGEDGSFIMRSLLVNERDFLEVDYVRSLRALWYTLVKPTLSRLGVLMDVVTVKGVPKYKADGTPVYKDWDAELSRYFGKMIDAGEMTYRDLMIVDSSRPRAAGSSLEHYTHSACYSYQVAAGLNPHVILCTEKDTATGIVRALATIFGCSWICGRGQNARSATEDLLYQIGPQDELVFLSITDHDPSGYSISNTFADQARVYQDRFGYSSIKGVRLGILPEQLTDEEIAVNQYQPKFSDEKQRREWMDYNGGEEWGLELDAFTPRRLREVFVEGLRPYVDTDTSFLKKSYIRALTLTYLARHLEPFMAEIEERFAEEVEIQDFDIFDLAVEGKSYLPVADLCTTEKMADLLAAIRERFDK